jgi:dipeptidyl aminopeptidase/acylaminoacyl peptidase
MKLNIIALASLTASFSIAAQAPRTLQHEDLWLMPRLSAPVISPKGDVALITLTEPAYDPAKQAQDLWLVHIKNGGARRLTNTLAAETGAIFSADGNTIAFSAQREGDSAAQIYTLSLQGGEAQRVTNAVHGARAPKFAADGKSIYFLSNVLRDAYSEAEQLAAKAKLAEQKSTARVYESFPIRYWDKWLDGKQIRPQQVSLESGVIRDLLAKHDILKDRGYGGRFAESGEEMDTAVLPDGSLLFTASRNRNRAAYSFTNTNLYRFDVKSDRLDQLTGNTSADAADDYARPTISADGKTLFALRTRRTAKVYNNSELVAFDLKAGKLSNERTLVLPGALSVSSFAIVGKRVVVSAEQFGREHLWQTDFSLAKVSSLLKLDSGVVSNLTSNGEQLIATFESATQPLKLVRVDLNGNKASLATLSDFAAERLKALALSPAEHFLTRRADGSDIHSMLIRPAGFDSNKRYPLLNLIHGGPHIMWRDAFFLRWNYHLIAQDKYVILLTNYRGSTGGGEGFAQSIQEDPFIGPTADLELAEDDALKRFNFIDKDRRCAGGASYGGHLANWIQAVNTTRYRCLISHAGLINSEAQWGTSDSIYGREINAGGPVWEQGKVWVEQNPIRRAASFKTPVLVTVGELDYRVPLNNTLEYWSVLQRQQVPSRLVVFPDENHWILKGENSKFFYGEVQQWLDKYLLGN